ncbi:MAG: amidophosphoribosyltransferase [FCB group bacterium]|nr:amidophosphoribosyltransferase [FCB group bacterium]
MCGIMGIYNNTEASTLAYMGLYAQQHRGQEGAGIVSANEGKLFRHMGQGLVSDVFSEPSVFDELQGNSAIGHVRYSTTGESDRKNVGPLMFNVDDIPISIAHNGNLVNAADVRRRLQQEGAIFQTSTDTEIIIHLLAREQGKTIADRLERALQKVAGAYSLLIITPDELIAARDPHGIRPFCLGRLKDAYLLASETCAFDLLGADYLRDIKPGEMLVIDPDGLHTKQIFPETQPRHCIFEHIYFSRPDSRIFDENVDKIRRKFSKILADEQPAPGADIVISVPDSSNTNALGYARRANLKYEIGLIRNHYVGRTFIFPSQRLRDLSVKLKFNTVRGVLKDREVVVVDDSIVRGTTLKKLTRLLKASGVKKVHVRIGSPPVRHPCFYGMDFPTETELLAADHSEAEMQAIIAVDSLGYLSIDGMLNATGADKEHFCTACFSGNYPVIPKGDHD